MNEKTFFVTLEYDESRLDVFLTDMYADKSRSSLQKIIKNEHVTVNGKIQKSNYKLHVDDEIVVKEVEPEELQIEPEDIPLDVLYEDEDVLVVNKPKGMVVHPAPGHYQGTLVNAIMYHCKHSLSGINGVIRPGIVHRIDMNTTGSIIVCKNDQAHTKIAKQIKEHSVTRRYRGIVIGNISQLEGKIDAPIGRHPVDRKKMAINEKNGKSAITHYKVLESLNGYTYMEFELETGRTHQIRVHMASIGHPLLGDDVYGPKKSHFKLQGQTLHAMTIGFIHPSTNQYIEVDAPIPEYFLHLLSILK